MAPKQTKFVEQPPSEEELVKTPSSSAKSVSVSAAGKQASDSDSRSETETEKKALVAKSKNNKRSKEAAHPSAVVALPNQKKKEFDQEERSTYMKEKRLGTEEKKPLFERLWSRDDEIVLLQTIIDFGMDPFKDKTRFHESIKSSISIEVTNSQLMAKIRSLRKNFIGKEKKCVEKFLKPHDHTCFEMSKVIWGVNGITVKNKVEEQEAEEDRKNVVLDLWIEDDWFERSFLVGAVASFGLDEKTVKEGWNLVPIERKMKIKEKLMRVLEDEGIRYVLSKMDIVRDVAFAIWETNTLGC